MESPGVGIPERALDLSFGFDDPKFSDRTLLLTIIDSDNDDGSSHLLRNVKRRRCEDHSFTLNTSLSPPQRVKTIHITSLILAARSPFFHRLFSNGMQESEQKHVTLRIEAREEVSFMDLMKYVYSNTVPTTLDALLDLCVTADKFEVASCLIDCTRALQNLPMTCELASTYLDLPPSLVMCSTVQPLIDASKNFLVAKFKDLHKFEEELLDLPLLSFQAVVSSDDLYVSSEKQVYNLVVKWARKHYPDLEERREILKTHLLHLIRFPFMTAKQLKLAQTVNDFDPELISKIVIRALYFKAETDSYEKKCLVAEDESRQFVERAYIHRPIKVVEQQSPHQHCVFYFNLTRDELQRNFSLGTLRSRNFFLDGQLFVLFAGPSPFNQFKFRLGLAVAKSSTCKVAYEFAVRKKPQEEIQSWFRGSHKFTVTENCKYLHGVEWTSFIGDNSPYFINDILHLRAELAIMK